MDDLDVLVGLGARGTGKSNPMRPDRGSVNDPLGFDYDSIFRSTEKNNYGSSSFNKTSTFNDSRGGGGGGGGGVGGDDLPVYDKPVYDDDIFEGLPGLKSNKPSVASSKETKFENDVFEYVAGKGGSEFDDLLGNISRNDKTTNGKSTTTAKGFDDLLPGLGSGSSGGSASRPISESRWGSVPTAGNKQQPILDDPFMVFESSSTSGLAFDGTAPQDKISKYSKSKSAKVDVSSGSAAVFDDLDPLSSIGKSRNAFSPQRKNTISDGSPPRSTTPQSASTREPKGNSSRHSESNIGESVPVDIFQEPPLFDIPKVSTEFHRSSAQKAASPPHPETGTHVKMSTTSGSANPFDDIWLTVSEIPLFTQLTSAPPPARPPPPVPRPNSRSETSSYSSSSRKKSDESSSPPNSGLQYQSPKWGRPEAKAPPVSQFDELEEFAMGRSHNSYDGNADIHSSMDGDAFSAAAASAAAMKDAMDKAEAKFRHAKELREREYAKAARSKESVQLEKDAEAKQEKELRETQERLERERKQKEEEEREQRKLEREREIRLREIERERARQAVERATREARERAAADARLRAERSAVEKANAEARERAERIAVQRAQAEARERAAAEARERAEKATAEARERAAAEKAATEARERVVEKAAAEAKEKEMREKAAAAKADAEARRRAERAVFERVAAEARGRAATEARERAAAATKMNQQKNDDDLESFFSMGRASSAPRARSSATDPFDSQFQSKGVSDAPKAPSSTGASSNMRKASSTTNFVDDLSSIFGAAPTGEFQEVDGESDERRRARLERQQRTQERAAKALAEKNQRDLQAQREQEERHRISETLDTEIKRWAAGKEGNLRALLSTLQYVLWPECGWQAVSLTDLITGASVKKVYRKATLCIHPDKVQQKGATLQQKYIAEKVFDLLKEAWNKFNSEELF